MWESTVGDRVLTFELVGLNNQNFIMEDRETGTWWQQVNGRGIRGPLTGTRLNAVPSEISTYGIWRKEHPDAQVLDADAEYSTRYFEQVPQNRGEKDMIPFAGDPDPDDPLKRGDLVVGIELNGESRAYPMRLLQQQRTVLDRMAGRDLLLVVGDDDETVRAFDRQMDGQVLELFRKPGTESLTLVDKETGSEWAFTGEAVNGELAGRRLERVPLITEYWFDWKHFHPDTRVFRAGR